MSNLITIKEFKDEVSFLEFTQILKNNLIEYETEVFHTTIDPVTMRPIEKEFNVKVDKIDFKKVSDLLNLQASIDIGKVDTSHYLFDFTDNELFDIISKSDEWSIFDFQLAKKILNDRGRIIDEDFLNSLKKNRLEALSKPEESQSAWIIIGYFSALFGGFLGIGIGWSIMSMQKTLPNGEKIYTYSDEDRRSGRNIFYIGIIVTILIVIWKISQVKF
jgi:hypothetical protein